MEVAPQLDIKLLHFPERNLFGSDRSKKNSKNVSLDYWSGLGSDEQNMCWSGWVTGVEWSGYPFDYYDY